MTFTTPFKSCACAGDYITCEVDGFEARATLYGDDGAEAPDERDDGFWPSLDPTVAGYIGPNKTSADLAEAMAKAEAILEAWHYDDWFYVGVVVTVSMAGVELTKQYDHALWGIDCNYPDSDNCHLLAIANDLLSEALDDAREVLVKLSDWVRVHVISPAQRNAL